MKSWEFLQDRFGVTSTTLVEDPEGVTIKQLLHDAIQHQNHKGASAMPGSQWVAPTPVSVKLRLFCLPYAGGISENVFARYKERSTRALLIA